MLPRTRSFVAFGSLLFVVAAFVYSPSRAQQTTVQLPKPNPPTIKLDSDAQVVTICPESESLANPRVRLKATGFSPDGLPLRYKWDVSGGRLEGDGTDVVWDLTGMPPGVYNAAVTLESGPPGSTDPLCTAFTSTKVVVRNCPPPGVCPTSRSTPRHWQTGAPITFAANVSGGSGPKRPSTVAASEGTITSGRAHEHHGGHGGPAGVRFRRPSRSRLHLECRASFQSSVPAPPQPRGDDSARSRATTRRPASTSSPSSCRTRPARKATSSATAARTRNTATGRSAPTARASTSSTSAAWTPAASSS